MTDLDKLKVYLQEKKYPYFSDKDLLEILELNNNNVILAAIQGCILKSNEDEEVEIGPISIKGAGREYWLHLAEEYRTLLTPEEKPKKVKTSMKRLDEI